jgi:hypothetical protein
MSLKAKEAQREKSKFAMQMRRELETKEQTALDREKQRLSKSRKRQAMTEEQTICTGELTSLQ